MIDVKHHAYACCLRKVFVKGDGENLVVENHEYGKHGNGKCHAKVDFFYLEREN